MANIQSMAKAALTFNKEGLQATGMEEDSTMPAIILIVLASVISGIVGLVTQTSTFNVPGQTTELGAVEALLINMVGTLLLFLLVSFVIGIFMGSEVSTVNVLRIAGATSVWTIIAAVIGFVLPSISGIISLVGFAALIYGLSIIAEKGILMTLIIVILAYIVVFFLIAFIFLVVLFGSLLA